VCPLIERISSDEARPKLLIADDHVIFADFLKVYSESKYLVAKSDAARRIKEQAPNMKFIFLIMRDDPNLDANHSVARPYRICPQALRGSATAATMFSTESLIWLASYELRTPVTS
jgi:hypothetical protein